MQDLAPAPDPSSTAALSRCSGGLERIGLGFELPASRAPTPAERGALTARVDRLREALRPAGRDEAARMVAALFATIPVGRAEAETTAEQIKLYAASLAELPVWAVASACRGHVDSGAAFRPAAGELLKRGRTACAAARAEAARIGQVLGAKVVGEVSAEERARIAGRFRAELLEALAPKPPQSFDGLGMRAGEGA